MEELLAPIENMGESHIAVALVVDKSISMMGRPIEELNAGLKAFGEAIQEDPLALGRADITVISFGSTVNTEMEFGPAVDYQVQELTVDGLTALNEAIDTALNALEARKKIYKDNGVMYYRPWLFVLTDGAASDYEKESTVKQRLRDYIERGKVTYFPMGIGESARIDKLRDYYPENAVSKPVLKADKMNFSEAFVWLSSSLVEITHSDPVSGRRVTLPQTPSQIVIDVV